MFNTLGIKSDYSILKSLIKIPDLISFCIENNLNVAGILDDNLFGSIEFYNSAKKNNIKPLIGLDITIEERHYFLYAKNYLGYKNLLKINTLVQKKKINIDNIKNYSKNIILVIPFNVHKYIDSFKGIFDDIFIAYKDEYEKKNAYIITNKLVCLSICNSLSNSDEIYFKILDSIRNDNKNNVCEEIIKISEEDKKINEKFIDLINIEFPLSQRHIPKYENEFNDSFKYLSALCHKGISKRLNNNVSDIYKNRLEYELNVIKDMGFTDYFLIVFDYVRYAKTHNIMVGVGRGSAGASLVSYSIGITDIDPIKYNLLFERFLNPERVTMPDIDIDFEDVKRDLVIDYVKEKYGKDRVAPVLTFGTLGARQVLKDVAKYFKLENKIDILTKNIDPKLSLKDNLKSDKVKSLLSLYPDFNKVYKISFELEGIKRHISTTAAGITICDQSLDDIIPICYSDDTMLTGVTLSYLEDLGILKMDFLGITNLTMIHNTLDLIKEKIDLNSINLEDEEVYKLFQNANTIGIFQFESEGMRNFLRKLKPSTFSDLYAALALFRPGPMNYIDDFINRKNGIEKIDYIDDRLKDILSETYGIIIYQEQIMLILRRMANYSFAEADNIRRAMSKKKEEIIIKEKENFINSSIKNGYSKEVALETYERILKFAGYGFNKAHSVSYAMIGYQQAYLKIHYKNYFIANLLNMTIGSESSTNKYLTLARLENLTLLKPSVNYSDNKYIVENNNLRLPLSIIKGIGASLEKDILSVREGTFKDYFDFVSKVYKKNVGQKTIQTLIYAGALDDFKQTRATLINNLDNALRYAELLSNLDESLVEKPILEIYEEYSSKEITKQEFDTFGFYVSNYPTSKYQDKSIVKLSKINDFFNKFIKCVVIISSIRTIKTKKGDNMAILNAIDETGNVELIVFPSNYNMIKNIKKDDLVEIGGRVSKRYSDYQINIEKIEKI